MKNLFLLYSFVFSVPMLFISCGDDDNNNANSGNNAGAERCYIVNQGGMNENDGTIQYYDFETGLATAADAEGNIFTLQNGEMLGDIAQDLLWVDEKLFVTVSGSQKLEVLDEEGKRLREPYRFEVEGASPRMMATDGKSVYMTNYDGNVYVYSASTAEFIKRIPVGKRPEGIVYIDGYLVVSNAGDLYAYNGTLSIVDAESGETTATIKMTNPYINSIVCNGEVYLIDAGNYYDIPSNVYRVSLDGTVTSLGFSASAIASYENCLYYVNTSYDENWTAIYSPLYALDVVTGERREILSSDEMNNVYSLSVNPENGDIFVGYAQYGVLGTMRIWGSDGEPKGAFGVGYYTCGVRFEN